MAKPYPENDAAALKDADYVDRADESARGSARRIFLDIVRTRFNEVVDGRSPGLTFSFAIVGAPWRYEWQGANMDIFGKTDEEARYELIHAAMMSARTAERDFFVTGFQRDAGTDWLGAERGHGAEQTRVYDREPIVVSSTRYTEQLFSPHWFEATVRGAIHVAAMVMPQLHPELKAFATIWRLANRSNAEMRTNDSLGGSRDFAPPEYFEDVVSAVEPIAVLTDGTAGFAQGQVAQCLRTLCSRYRVQDDVEEPG